MFCCLYVLNDRTKINHFEKEHCFESCKFWNGKCSVLDVRNERLTKHKYSWILEKRIKFTPPVASKSGKSFYESVICLIHPASSDLWIVRVLRDLEAKNVFYNAFCDGKSYELQTIEDLNKWLKDAASYDGREIIVHDFE